MTVRNSLIRQLLFIVLMFSIFSCFGKKPKRDNLESWLNKNFPEKFVVLNNRRDMQPRFFIEKKMTSVVASAADPELQFIIDWYKDKPDLGVSKVEIQSAYDHSHRETEESRALFKEVKDKGIASTSVCVIEDASYFLIYAEPTPDKRRTYLKQIVELLNQLPDHNQTSIWIEFMEDSVYQHEFKDIIPKGYWDRPDTYHQRNKTVSLYFDWTPDLNIDELMHRWTVNIQSDRSGIFMADAFKIASQWAEKNLPQPYYLEPDQMVQIGLDETDLMAIHFDFPYFLEKPAEDGSDFDQKLKGYVSGVYQTDLKTFSKIKKVKEL
jgi:hypothetical protein